ncbi:MAG TPA: glycosyltransferase [Phototrophicaceae bacterium]|nr:glycosyltransferase [Phototrophicaceae bacterium]
MSLSASLPPLQVPLRVIHIIYAPGIAGAERHLLDLLAGMRERGIDARFILLVDPGSASNEMQQAAEARGIPVQRVMMYRSLDFSLFGRLRTALQTLKPDVVHTHLAQADVHGIIAARLARIPVVVLSRHNDDPRYRKLVRRTVYQLLWRLANGGIAISNAVRRFNIEVEGAVPAKVHTIHYGLPLPITKQDKPTVRKALREEIAADSEALVVGMVCRLMDAKGLPDAINAFAKIAPDFPTAQFVIAGDGPLKAELAAQIQQLKMTGQIHMLGWRDPMPVMAALDVLLMPSVREGFGLTLLEAMSQAIPIIGSTASAIPEIVLNGQTGITVPPRNPDALVEAMRTLLNDKPLRMHLGMLGEERLETQFSAARMVDETLNLYEKLKPGLKRK